MLCTVSGTQDWENLIVITPDDMELIEKLLLLTLICSIKQSFSTSSIRELSCTDNDLSDDFCNSSKDGSCWYHS